jgi:hypothetical protein
MTVPGSGVLTAGGWIGSPGSMAWAGVAIATIAPIANGTKPTIAQEFNFDIVIEMVIVENNGNQYFSVIFVENTCVN